MYKISEQFEISSATSSCRAAEVEWISVPEYKKFSMVFREKNEQTCSLQLTDSVLSTKIASIEPCVYLFKFALNSAH